MPSESLPLLLAPWIEIPTLRHWIEHEDSVEFLDKYGVSIDLLLTNFLDSLQPRGHGNIRLGYTVPINVYDLFRKDAAGHWHFDAARMEFFTDLFRKAGRPVVVNLRANHFVGEDPLVAELMAHGSSFARLNNGASVIDDYYSNPVFAPTFSIDEAIPLNRFRFGGFSQAASVLAEFDRQHPDIIHAVTLAGELHHFLPELANPTAAGQFQGARMTDYSPESIRDFVVWLKTRHGSLEELNSRFATPFETWEQIDPPRWDFRSHRQTPLWSQMDSYADGCLPVFGWMEAPNGSLTVYLDGRPVGQAEYGFSRLDVYEAVPDMADSDLGFRFDLDYRALSPGRHMVHVVLERENGEKYLVGDRRIHINGSAQAADSGSFRHLDKLPPCRLKDRTFGCLDHPPNDLALRFNPYAAEWHEFRKHQVQALLLKFAELALQAGIAREKLYSHQIVPHFEGTWNRVAFAVPEPSPGSPFSAGVDLYGGATVYRGLMKYLQGSQYAVPEMHPRMGRPQNRDIFLRALEYHRDLGAAFISPYFMALREPNKQRITADPHSNQDGMMIHPLNVGLGSMFYYSAIVAFLNGAA